MEDGAALRMVQRRRPVARAQQERREHRGGDQLKPQSPANGAEKFVRRIINIVIAITIAGGDLLSAGPTVLAATIGEAKIENVF